MFQKVPKSTRVRIFLSALFMLAYLRIIIDRRGKEHTVRGRETIIRESEGKRPSGYGNGFGLDELVRFPLATSSLNRKVPLLTLTYLN